MAKEKKQQPEGKEKKGGFGAAFRSFSGVIDEIVNEVKQDLREMTPAEATAAQKRQQHLAQQSNALQGVVGSSTYGLSENVVPGMEQVANPQNTPAKPEAHGPVGLPPGNLWLQLTNPQHSANLRTDACYHALTAADVESYAKAIGHEAKPPYTLGVVAVNIAAADETEAAEGAPIAPDLLTQTLLKTLAIEPRLFGAVGAGPRQLWPTMQALDDFLVNLLNTERKLIALGPIGLDEPFAPYKLKEQQDQLELQLKLAAEFQIPALITTRKTQQKLAEVLERVKASANGLPQLVYLDALATPEDAQLVQTYGMHILVRPELTAPDFSGTPFYRSMPAERLLLASGSALVAPHGFAGHFNQPKFLENSLQAAAKLRGVGSSGLGQTTSANLVHLFKIA